jgi:hypothetical protein
MKLALPFLTAAAMVNFPLFAQDGVPGDPATGGLTCTVGQDGVVLEWNFAFFAPIQGFFIDRDGVQIAALDPSATRFVDAGAPAGEHAYSLSAENLNGGDKMLLADCTVTVPPGGLRCAVDGNHVTIQWDPLLIAVVVQSFEISRDGALIATVPGNQFSYQETVALGDHGYKVAAVVGPDSRFAIGSCEVSVVCYGLEASVDGLKVSLKWSPAFNNPAGPIVSNPMYFISRDGQAIAETPDLSYVDEVPGPGIYLYEVVFDLGTGGIPAILIAACKVSVPGDGPPAPQDLRCQILLTADGNVLGGGPIARLTWINGADYASIIVLRDNGLLATLDGGPAGESRSYDDVRPPSGVHSYCVVGVIGDPTTGVAEKTAPACCQVTVPGGGIVPPQNLTCTVIDVAADPALPPSLFTGVLLEWENPPPGLCPTCGDGYQKIVILRNGMVIASLAGTATSFKDQVVGGGVFEYQVCGFTATDKGCASCTIDIPPGDVPPPQDFTCNMLDVVLQPGDPDANGQPAPAPGDVLPLPAVVLKWANPLRYSGLVVSRDKAIIARLPGDAMVYRDIAPPEGLHVYGIQGFLADNRASPVVTCEIVVGEIVPPVTDLVCGVEEKANPDTVDLAWKNGAEYRGIVISRNGEPLAKLTGDSTSYQDSGLKPGTYLYAVVGVTLTGQSPPAFCMAEVAGPPAGKLLYFSGGVLGADPAGNIPGAAIGSRITCLATTDEDVQAWSFGVQSDPKFIVVKKYDLDDTVTMTFNGGAGPAFLSVKILPAGLVMAAVIEDGSTPPVETLPPGSGHKLLNIEYASGPSGAEGEAYPVRYSNALGDPPVQVFLVVNGFEVRPSTLPGLVSIPLQGFLRGDVDGNGSIDINDPVAVLNWLFLGGDSPKCMEAADANGTRDVNIADPVYLLSFLFLDGAPPPAPFPECGQAPSPLGCADPGSCK